MRSSRPLLSLLTLMAAAPILRAQQTIFNVPSADITPKSGNYFEGELQYRFWTPGEYLFGNSFYARGIGANTEIDVSLFNTSVPASGNVTLGTGFKTAIPLSSKNSLQLTVGGQLLTSLQNQGVGYWAYAHLSGKLPTLNTRLTAGISNGTRQLFGSQNTAFIAGIEQPISPNVAWLTDWFSGSSSEGFVTTGFAVGLTKTVTLYQGYQVPNRSQSAGRQGFTTEISWTF